MRRTSASSAGESPTVLGSRKVLEVRLPGNIYTSMDEWYSADLCSEKKDAIIEEVMSIERRASGTRMGLLPVESCPEGLWIWSWNLQMKGIGQIPDLVDRNTRHVKWYILCLQEAAMELENVVDMIPGGHCVYIAKAPSHVRSVAMVVRADIVRLITKVVYGERYMYIDFGSKTEEAIIPTLRLGMCHLPPEGGHHTAEEFSSILQSVEEAMQLGRRAVQIWGFDTNIHMGRRHEGEQVGSSVEGNKGSYPERATEFSELLGVVGVRAMNMFKEWGTMHSGTAAPPHRQLGGHGLRLAQAADLGLLVPRPSDQGARSRHEAIPRFVSAVLDGP